MHCFFMSIKVTPQNCREKVSRTGLLNREEVKHLTIMADTAVALMEANCAAQPLHHTNHKSHLP